MANIHINVTPGLPRNEVIRVNNPDDASGTTPSHKTEGTSSDSLATKIAVDKTGSQLAMRLPG